MGATGNNNLDLTFFTNDENGSLLERFRRVLKTTRYFDVLVGYFRASGFFNLYQSLENVEKIRVIVGLKLDEHTWDIYRHAREGSLVDAIWYVNSTTISIQPPDNASIESLSNSDPILNPSKIISIMYCVKNITAILVFNQTNSDKLSVKTL